MSFQSKLDLAVSKNDSLLCINLDPDDKVTDIFAFNKKIIDETHSLVCSYKPNSAFYEARGAAGIETLKKTIEYIQKVAPDLAVILDAKRGDIGNTNYKYAEFAFGYLKADALTIHPYLGGTSLIPFFEYKDKGFFVLGKTSNKGAGELQDLEIEGKPLYLHVAENIIKNWNYNNNCMLVMGATYPEALGKVRGIVGEMTILVPGVGHQGGDLEKIMKSGLTGEGKGLIIAVGRSILTAENPQKEAEQLRDKINSLRTK